jgi:hypothetical protein
MTRNSYDIARLNAEAGEWDVEAARATLPPMRAFCLREAARCRWMVQRSMAIPVLDAQAKSTASSRERFAGFAGLSERAAAALR